MGRGVRGPENDFLGSIEGARGEYVERDRSYEPTLLSPYGSPDCHPPTELRSMERVFFKNTVR